MPTQFTARVVHGRGRGKHIGTPTINFEMEDVPPELKEGIYACRVSFEINNQKLEMSNAVMHYGPRLVFDDTKSCEVHLLDREVSDPPENVEVTIVAYLREVRNFASVEALKAQIADDIADARAVLQ